MMKYLWRLFFGKRIVLLVGHSNRDQGAEAHTRVSEYRYWRAVADSVAESCKHDIKVETKDVGTLRTTGNHYLFELHFNSFDKHVSGCEAIYPAGSEKVAIDYCEFVSKALGNRNRGPKLVDLVHRGKSNVLNGSKMAKQMILCEPFFGDNPDDYVSINVMAQVMTGFLNQL